MSIESAREFYQKISSDESLRTRVMSAPFAQKAEIVKAEGYDFYQEEWDIVTSETIAVNEDDQEMSDEELELVAGGRTNVALYGLPTLPF